MSSIDLFSTQLHQYLQTKVKESYLELISDLREDIKEGFETDHLSEGFQHSFKTIILSKDLDNFSPLHFYWSSLLDNLIYLVQLHEEGQEAEEEIFDFWNAGEDAENFQQLLASGETVLEASLRLRILLENQILAFYQLHLNQKPQSLEEPLIYRVIPEIGDSEKRIYITSHHHIVDFDQALDIFPSLALADISEDKKIIELEIEKSFSTFNVKNPSSLIEDGFSLLPQCDSGRARYDDLKEKVQHALSIIQKGSPQCYETLKSFSHSFIPINEPGIVSYSLQSLPGYSSINMFERDFVDLIDDLVHENGHHFLNTYLNHIELINEDDDKIYYSPWRRALRPIRGIYHAVFTFYWALKLFGDLSDNLALFEEESQKQKVCSRAIEEFVMLNFCMPALEHAYKNGKIQEKGQELILTVFDLIKEESQKIEKLKENLNKENSKRIRELQAELEEKAKQYQL